MARDAGKADTEGAAVGRRGDWRGAARADRGMGDLLGVLPPLVLSVARVRGYPSAGVRGVELVLDRGGWGDGTPPRCGEVVGPASRPKERHRGVAGGAGVGWPRAGPHGAIRGGNPAPGVLGLKRMGALPRLPPRTRGGWRPFGPRGPNVRAPASGWQSVAKISWGGFVLVLVGLPVFALGWWVAFVRSCDYGSGAEPGMCGPIGLAAPYLVVGATFVVVGTVLLVIEYNARHYQVTRAGLLHTNFKP